MKSFAKDDDSEGKRALHLALSWDVFLIEVRKNQECASTHYEKVFAIFACSSKTLTFGQLPTLSPYIYIHALISE